MNTTKRPRTTQNDFETMQAILSGQSRLETIGAALGISTTATQDRLKQLKRKGYAETIKGGKTWSITPEGVQALEAAKNAPPQKPKKTPANGLEGSIEVSNSSVNTAMRSAKPLIEWQGLQQLEGWSALMTALPIAEYRAALRLVLALALLRNRAPHLAPMPWIGLYGATGTGKSTVAMCARAIVSGHFFQVGTMTSGEVIGRRSRKAPYTIEATPRTMLGAITDLDELAEATPEVQTAIYALLQQMGETVTIEGQSFSNKAVIVATWNPKAQTVPLPVGSLRRGLRMDTTPFAKRLEKAFNFDMIGSDIRAVLEGKPEPWLNLVDIPAPLALEPDPLRTGQRVLFSVLKTPNNQPLAALPGLAAAYKVLLQLDDRAAIAEAVSDFATLCATQTDTMRDHWRETIGAHRAEAALGPTLETTAPETNLETPAEQVKRDLELTKARAHTVTRASNAVRPIKQHWAALEPHEKEVASPIVAALQAIGEGAPHAHSERLEALRTELDTLEGQAVRCARAIGERIAQEQQHAMYMKQAEEQRRLHTKAWQQDHKERAKKKREYAKALKQAVQWKDSKPDSSRAQHRARVVSYLYKHDLESRKRTPLPSETGKGWAADMVRHVENFTNSFGFVTYERGTEHKVYDLEQWMLNKAAQLEEEAANLERKADQAKALPSPSKPALPATNHSGWQISEKIITV
jgi:predicted transcriptional regulator